MTVSKEDEYDLVPVTEEEALVDFTRHQNGGAWAGVLTKQQYVTREKLIETYLPKGAMNVYSMVNKSTGERVSSVEIIIRDSVIYRKTEGGKVEKQKCLSGCIGGVYTYEEYRGQGLARIMIDKLVKKYEEGILKDGFIHLYSEVGEYYRKSGFISKEVPVIRIKVDTDATREFSDVTAVDEGQLSMYGFKEFSGLMQMYYNDNDEEIKKNTLNDGKTRVTVTPSTEMINWYHARAKYFHNTLFDHKLIKDAGNVDETSKLFKTIGPKYFGMKLRDGMVLVGFIIWTYDWSTEGNCIKVILVHIRPQYDQGLRLKLLKYLNEYINYENKTGTWKDGGFPKMEVWQSEVPGVEPSSLGDVITNGSLSALRMCDKEEHEKWERGDLVWENNNKLPWF